MLAVAMVIWFTDEHEMFRWRRQKEYIIFRDRSSDFNQEQHDGCQQ